MESDASQEEKQNYLRENILEKGYDANQFVAFLQSKKGEAGSDISNWSMVDLYEVVQEFISKNSPKKESEPISPQQQEPVSQNNQNISSSEVKINIPKRKTQGSTPTLTDEDYGLIIPEFLNCQKSETTDLSKYDEIEISVKEPKKVNNGFFSKTFINYLITTNPLDINVRRKHDDFTWLRERLSIIFNLNILPRLPKKGKVNEDKHINKRIRNLEKFLNYLVKDPLIKNSNILYDFLTMENDKDFEKRKKIYNKMKTPTELKDIKTIDGIIRINVTANKEIYLDNIKANSAFNETCLKKFNQNFKLLKEEMNTVIGRVLSFSPLFDKLIKISTTYLESSTIIESYNQMKNIFNSCADMLKRQSGFFYNDVKEYLKLLSGNYHHTRELVQIVEAQKNNYNKASKNLISKKIELFKKGDTNAWQLDIKDRNNLQEFYSDRIASYKKICFKETNNVIKVKEKYGYHLNKIISEFKRMKNINIVEHKNKVIQFATKESEIVSDFFKIMGEIIGVMEKYKENATKEDNNMEQEVQPPVDVNNIDENNNISTKELEKEDNQINNEVNEDKNKEENKNEEKEEENKNEIKEEENKNEIKEENKNEIEEKDKNEIKEDNKNESKEDNKNEIKEDKNEINEKEKVDEKEIKENKNEDKKEEENQNEIKNPKKESENLEGIKNEKTEAQNIQKSDDKIDNKIDDKNEDKNSNKDEENKKDVEEKKEGEIEKKKEEENSKDENAEEKKNEDEKVKENKEEVSNEKKEDKEN